MVGTTRKRGEIPFASLAEPGEDGKEGNPVGHHWSFGDDIIVFYRNSDLAALQEKFGEAWFNDIIQKVMASTQDFGLRDILLDHGVKKRLPDGKRVAHKFDEDALDEIPAIDVFEVLFDGLCISMLGISSREYFDEVAKKTMEALQDNDPPSSRPNGLSSTISE